MDKYIQPILTVFDKNPVGLKVDADAHSSFGCFNFWQHLGRVAAKKVGLSKKCYFAAVDKNFAEKEEEEEEEGGGNSLIYQTSLS